MQTDNKDDPKPVQQLMLHHDLATIVKKTQLLNQINQCLLDILPTSFNNCCQVVNIRANCLILAANNSAIATRIRYQETALIAAIHQRLGNIDIMRIKCTIQPNLPMEYEIGDSPT